MAHEAINNGVLAKIDRNLLFEGQELAWRDTGHGDTRGDGAAVCVSVAESLQRGARALAMYGYRRVAGSFRHGSGYDCSIKMEYSEYTRALAQCGLLTELDYWVFGIECGVSLGIRQ